MRFTQFLYGKTTVCTLFRIEDRVGRSRFLSYPFKIGKGILFNNP